MRSLFAVGLAASLVVVSTSASASAADVAPAGGCCRRCSVAAETTDTLGAFSLAALVPLVLRRRRRHR